MRPLAFLGGLPVLGGTIAAPAFGQAPLFGDLHTMVPWERFQSSALALGDLDGDGDVDVLLGKSSLRLYLNAGDGLLSLSPTPFPSLSTAVKALALGDVDGDGDLDVLVGNSQFDDRLYRNDGNGLFTFANGDLPTWLGPDDTRGIAVGDLDGDGDLDALFANGWAPALLYRNMGGGVFDYGIVESPGGGGTIQAIAIGDVDGDGDLDAFLGTSEFGDRLHKNNGSAFFSSANGNLPYFDDDTAAVALGDADGDGDLDAWTANYGDPDRLYLNDGTGSFTSSSGAFPPGNDYATSMAVGDVDDDGDLDAMVGALSAPDRLLLNDGTGTFSNGSAQIPPNDFESTSDVALADMDGDGDLDGFWANGALISFPGFQNRLRLNDGNGVFAETNAQLPPGFDTTLDVATGDVDGDGDPDILVANFVSPERLFLNDGTGIFADGSSQFPPGVGLARAIALGDVDGDGDLDAYLGNQAGSLAVPDRLYLNDGGGTFSDASSQIPPHLDPTEAVVLGDVDGDGDLDVVVGNTFTPGVSDHLYLNDGGGTFSDATSQLPPILDNTVSLALGDVDGDGDLDLFVGNGPSGTAFGGGTQSRLYRNDGGGIFADATANLPSLTANTEGVALGDLDGDGDLDAYLANGQEYAFLGAANPQDRLYRNDGAGVFTDSTSDLPADGDFATSVALGDVDGDGDLDVFVGNGVEGTQFQGDPNRLYLNAGTGVFSDATASLPPFVDATAAVALADLDGDGDLDAFDSGRPSRILTNLTAQLAWRAIPRVGKPLRLEMYGPPAGAWFRALSLAAASIPLPPFGVLRLHPASFLFLGAGPLDALGRASVTVPVPAVPALVGVTFYEQALVGPPFRLTNLEIVPLSPF
jgi:VCBS repeat protein